MNFLLKKSISKSQFQYKIKVKSLTIEYLLEGYFNSKKIDLIRVSKIEKIMIFINWNKIFILTINTKIIISKNKSRYPNKKYDTNSLFKKFWIYLVL